MSDTMPWVGECADLDVAARAVEPDGSGRVTGRRRLKADQDGEGRGPQAADCVGRFLVGLDHCSDLLREGVSIVTAG